MLVQKKWFCLLSIFQGLVYRPFSRELVALLWALMNPCFKMSTQLDPVQVCPGHCIEQSDGRAAGEEGRKEGRKHDGGKDGGGVWESRRKSEL